MKQLTEAQEQELLAKWLTIHSIFFYANVNENNTFKQSRKWAMINEKKAQRVGKKRGVCDMTIFLDNYILYLEMKKSPKVLKNGKLSYANIITTIHQKGFINEVNKYPYSIALYACGFSVAKEIVSNLLKGATKQEVLDKYKIELRTIK